LESYTYDPGRIRKKINKISKILSGDFWDPIGVRYYGVDDEYDSYIPTIYQSGLC
jgi:hypothetical protein